MKHNPLSSNEYVQEQYDKLNRFAFEIKQLSNLINTLVSDIIALEKEQDTINTELERRVLGSRIAGKREQLRCVKLYMVELLSY